MPLRKVEYRCGKNEDVRYHGRNGYGFCIGLNIWRVTFYGLPTLTLNPVNSKGDEANCQIDIPLADVPQLITALQQFWSEHQQELTDDKITQDN